MCSHRLVCVTCPQGPHLHRSIPTISKSIGQRGQGQMEFTPAVTLPAPTKSWACWVVSRPQGGGPQRRGIWDPSWSSQGPRGRRAQPAAWTDRDLSRSARHTWSVAFPLCPAAGRSHFVGKTSCCLGALTTPGSSQQAVDVGAANWCSSFWGLPWPETQQEPGTGW